MQHHEVKMDSNIDTKQAALNAAFVEASWDGDFNAARIALDNGASVSATAPFVMHAIIVNKEILQLCIERGGIDQELLDTSLMFCFNYNHKESAAMLLKAGANISYTVSMISPHSTATLDNEMLEILIKTGKPSQEFLNDVYGHAVAKGIFENANILKSCGAQSTAEIDFLEACHKGDFEAVKKALDSGISLNSGSTYGNTAISIAMRYPEILELFIAHKDCTQQVLDIALIRINWAQYEYNSEGKREHKYDIPVESAKLILKAGANPNYKHQYDNHAEYAIDHAVNYPKILEAFIATGKLTQETLDRGLSEVYKEVESVKLLLNAGASVNAEGALENATHDMASFKLFMAKGGIEQNTLNKALWSGLKSYNLKSMFLKSPELDLSEDERNEIITESKELLEVAKLLSEAGAELTTDMIWDLASDTPEILELLKSYCSQENLNKAFVEVMESRWSYDFVPKVKLLLDLGADVNTKNSNGEYVIKYLAHDPELLVALLEKGGISADAMKSMGFSVVETTMLLLNQHKTEAVVKHEAAPAVAEQSTELDQGMPAHEASGANV